MPVGEFAGTDRLQFSADSVRLQTLGIPFAAKDVLYVRARAQTFVKGLDGYSTELKFPVKSPIETRKELREQLEKIREALKEKPQGEGQQFQSWKSDLSQKLSQSTQTAALLGRQSTPARALNQARDLAARMTEPSDKQIHAIDARVRDALEALKRQDAQERAGSWFMKMRSFLEKLERSDLGATDKREAFAKDGAGLRDEALEMKTALQQMIDSPRGGLSLDEKQAALAALESDETPERVTEMNASIDAAARDQALSQGRQALDEATEKLGSILQLMANARARMTKDARERLGRADEQLEGARQSTEKAKQQSMAGAAQRALDGTPQLGESFNEALAQAQEGSRGVQSALSNNKDEEVKSELDRTQRAIAEALSALQEEEQSERNDRNQEEGRRYRSAMDAMNAQGQLDAGWRRKIFEEISRLRESGVPADADIIRYLESRLR
jgi:hypothetical protein